MRRPMLVPLVSALAAFAAAAAEGGQPPRAAKPTPPDVVLISVDALRADGLGCYGGARPTSPTVDRLAAEGVRFERAYATSSWTVPSMASIFTGLYPRGHGVRRGLRALRPGAGERDTLSDDISTLAERLRAAGYRTFGVASNAHLAAGTGFERGFEHYADLGFAAATEVNAAALAWREQLAEARPYFLWVHYFDPHDPYGARSPYIERFRPDLDAAVVERFSGMPMRLLRPLTDEVRRTPGLVEDLRALYDSEVALTDRHIGELLAALPRPRSTLVVVTADHGDGFLEHGTLGHGNTVYEELVRVPLVVRLPGPPAAARVVDEPVSLVDLVPTVCELTGLAAPEGLPGRSLVPALGGRAAAMAPALFVELAHRGTFREAVILGNHKLEVRGRERRERHLYDLARDPAERHDLLAAQPERAHELAALLAAFLRDQPEREATTSRPELDAAHIESLRSLGYID